MVDYKTGTVPRAKDLAAGGAPQLPIEAWLLEEGAFPGSEGGTVTDLLYWRLTGGEQAGEVRPLGASAEDGTPFAALARDRLVELAEKWLLGTAPFASRPHPARSAAGGISTIWRASRNGRPARRKRAAVETFAGRLPLRRADDADIARRPGKLGSWWCALEGRRPSALFALAVQAAVCRRGAVLAATRAR